MPAQRIRRARFRMDDAMTGSPSARRVLIIEDEMLIALMLQEMLQEVGLIVEGVASTLPAGLDMARNAEAQLAILDINLNGQEAYPIAEVLQGRGIPFIFSTGYGAGSVKPPYVSVPQLLKPYQQETLSAAIQAAFSSAA